MELLEKAYKTNLNGDTIEEIVVNEVFDNWEEFLIRANQFEGYLIQANHHSEIKGVCATTREGESVYIQNRTISKTAEWNKDSIVKQIIKRLKKIEIEVEKIEFVERESIFENGSKNQFDIIINNDIKVRVDENSTFKTPTRMSIKMWKLIRINENVKRYIVDESFSYKA